MATGKVLDLKTFVPAEDFELSKNFYLDLGFRQNWGDSQIAEFEIDGYRFLLQKFYVPDHAGNFMMSLMVENTDEWWEHIHTVGLVQKYNLRLARPPKLQPWGLRVLFLADPSGVLWHISDRRESQGQADK